ncbi:type VI secretion system-associated protein VasI [Grimontia sp. NTOU-MAR1]|uniref:type VI secretion system-associated protein VasI n=1 Tax=Grimontia sp. NTOU-MAR1 TaxID=3111011 RepID=UPI002DC02FE5|nr:type VI secretion system-associated protein VasI [Grimontia sp. NTOU-MAR1]WRV99787.1 type VI secretion system-associated protein VasI [Grimontia sp. NTOU-MAR1]
MTYGPISLCLMMAGLTLSSFNAPASDTDNTTLFESASACTLISARLDRLACFDEVFKTPVSGHSNAATIVQKPEAWERAKQSESEKSEEETGFTLSYANLAEPKSGIWMTATALPDRNQKKNEMPILMFSCIDNISRVELILPNATSEGKAEVIASGSYNVTQRWLSDDTGNIMRAGRGIPAIDVMKVLMSGQRAVLRSDLGAIGNLTFDTADLRESIKPMRQTCRW